MLSLNYAGGILVQFDTVHEYNFYPGRTHLHYCDQHETFMIVNHQDSTNRLMIEGITKDEIDELRLELNKAHLEATTNVTNQNEATC